MNIELQEARKLRATYHGEEVRLWVLPWGQIVRVDARDRRREWHRLPSTAPAARYFMEQVGRVLP